MHHFSTLFNEPTGLPPPRLHDHRILLAPNNKAVNVRPYRYLHYQKNKIEKIVAALLGQGVIRPSVSPYLSPILLVKKHDGSWCMCVDYRALNKLPIRDKFPISLIDELLDELHGTRYFSKLDLCSGYHQVRMWPMDVDKTTFRTH
ncbi:hypothetical protein Dimus_038152 [Dionaea muscipula]